MRKFKFRAWDKKICGWVTDFIISLNGFPTRYYTEFDGTEHRSRYDIYKGDIGAYAELDFTDFYGENIVLMQYTGLKDKNGKEIYESDIVRATRIKYKKETSWIARVVWDNGFVLSVNKSYLIDHAVLLVSSKLEVIGNIYENPELLKEEQK